MTNCPAYVPVMVELCPEASNAAAKRLLAAVPKTFFSISGAFCSGRSMMSRRRSPVGSTKSASSDPRRAATMTTAQLMKRVTANASADSAMLYLSADRSDRSPILNVLESTRAECRKGYGASQPRPTARRR